MVGYRVMSLQSPYVRSSGTCARWSPNTALLQRKATAAGTQLQVRSSGSGVRSARRRDDSAPCGSPCPASGWASPSPRPLVCSLGLVRRPVPLECPSCHACVKQRKCVCPDLLLPVAFTPVSLCSLKTWYICDQCEKQKCLIVTTISSERITSRIMIKVTYIYTVQRERWTILLIVYV
ncbi:hypothetical protein ANANG_G00256540 [Anguilla anguilla]|uniref:Uncharacterized protein n=1 Tax=Anguilla anguilla TaxID=7936 RepID=A0A9D3LT67_ANGAN|nr:hypothetical protein ANANG_G00256540 [Anguilla anguilla]